MIAVPQLRSRFTIKTRAGGAVLTTEVVECADEEHAIELARTRLANAVPGVSIEVWARRSLLWSSLTSSALLSLAQISASAGIA